MSQNVLSCRHETSKVMKGSDEQGDELCVHVCDDCSEFPCFSDFRMEVVQ